MVCMAISSIFNIPQLISRLGLAPRLLHFTCQKLLLRGKEVLFAFVEEILVDLAVAHEIWALEDYHLSGSDGVQMRNQIFVGDST